MISSREVHKLAYEQKVSEQTIERDYILTWILIELSRHASLGDHGHAQRRHRTEKAF